MCDNQCNLIETFNPEVEYQKFLKRKPIVQTAKLYEELKTHQSVNKRPYDFKGYGVEADQNTMYRTYNSEYGYYAPNPYTIPSRYYPLSQKFSNELHRCGMYRNFSLNTHMDRSFY
ncbi:piercer of microtubule wall 1 protein-like [Musca vetustissima]|uniref:piercer of microtubule wall 1 protein-like n=1 Tax=Musca vetustissima TaxID=27455 RepID=UPI002AB7CB64|nr:piercer of microtubule wall 1 protein-like [Musca vetustissima]